jgi:transglutaminase-like putative cysteine protease
MPRWLRRLLGYNDYDLKGRPFKYRYRRRGPEGLIDVREYIRPEEISFELLGLDYKEIYRYLQDRLTYEKDDKRFGLKNYWQTPGQYQMRSGYTGDCEDSALWLASALEKNEIKYRVVLGCYGDYWERRRRRNRINHAWVVVRDKRTRKWMILETTSRTARPIRADRTYRYLPRISFDARQIWVHRV